MDPIRPVGPDDSIAAVLRVADARVRRETPDEAAERRRREQQERARRQAARAWADAQLRAVEQQHEQGYVSEDESDDGHPHVDIRV
jgi:hypothetical protein